MSTSGERSTGTPDDPRSDEEKAAAARIAHQDSWVDLQVRQAMARGEFDDLPGHGRPIEGLGGDHDPDWWVKRLVEREQITGVLPPSLQLRKEDAELDERLDRLPTESGVRRGVEEFNERVRWAWYQPSQGPPMITQLRDLDLEVDRWQARKEERIAAHRAARRAAEEQALPRRRRSRLRGLRWPRVPN